MRSIVLPIVVLAAISQPAFAAKPCEELKTEIAAKLDKAGVKNYVLDVVTSDKVGDAKVVGSCELGSKKITYVRKKS